MVVRQSGFTLMELAVVLMIVGLLLGGLLIPLSSQQDLQGRQATEKALADIREALIGFAVINGRLPCPAQADIADNATHAGAEAISGSGATQSCACTTVTSDIAGWTNACSGSTTSITGVLPWATLGLLETDAWDRRYTYRVNSVFSRGVDSAPTLLSTFGTGCSITQVSDMPTKAAFALCTWGDISILSAAGGVSVASTIPAIVISHGKNGLGAWLPTGGQMPGAAGDELENADDNATFVSNHNIDDQLTWIPRTVLVGRMISAAKLP